MKTKFMTIAMSMALLGTVSCSKNDLFEENKSILAEQEKTEYATNYVKQYGAIDSNQSWDFSSISNAPAATRAGESLKCRPLNPLTEFILRFIDDDLDQVKSAINNAEVKTFNPYLSVDLFPAYSNVVNKNGATYYKLAVCYNDEKEVVSVEGVGLKNGWSTLGRLGKEINSKSLTTASNVYWSLYPTQGTLLGEALLGENIIGGTAADYKIDTYKEFKVNGRTYWGFRKGANGSYSDLICMVRNIDPVRPIEKRYMIEDLGSKKDFDFNDVVVDVIQAIDGSQKAIIRAMGGTIDFTLTIGNTVWSKGVQGVAAGYKVETMYNTENPKWDDVLVEFPVQGWNPSTNNVTLTAKSLTNEDVILSIPFPRVGEVPMIIALDTFVDWQKERVSLPKDWWVPVEEETEAAE